MPAGHDPLAPRGPPCGGDCAPWATSPSSAFGPRLRFRCAPPVRGSSHNRRAPSVAPRAPPRRAVTTTNSFGTVGLRSRSQVPVNSRPLGPLSGRFRRLRRPLRPRLRRPHGARSGVTRPSSRWTRRSTSPPRWARGGRAAAPQHARGPQQGRARRGHAALRPLRQGTRRSGTAPRAECLGDFRHAYANPVGSTTELISRNPPGYRVLYSLAITAFEHEPGVQTPWPPSTPGLHGGRGRLRRRPPPGEFAEHGRINIFAAVGYVTPEIQGKYFGYLSPFAAGAHDNPNGLRAYTKVLLPSTSPYCRRRDLLGLWATRWTGPPWSSSAPGSLNQARPHQPARSRGYATPVIRGKYLSYLSPPSGWSSRRPQRPRGVRQDHGLRGQARRTGAVAYVFTDPMGYLDATTVTDIRPRAIEPCTTASMRSLRSSRSRPLSTSTAPSAAAFFFDPRGYSENGTAGAASAPACVPSAAASACTQPRIHHSRVFAVPCGRSHLAAGVHDIPNDLGAFTHLAAFGYDLSVQALRFSSTRFGHSADEATGTTIRPRATGSTTAASPSLQPRVTSLRRSSASTLAACCRLAAGVTTSSRPLGVHHGSVRENAPDPPPWRNRGAPRSGEEADRGTWHEGHAPLAPPVGSIYPRRSRWIPRRCFQGRVRTPSTTLVEPRAPAGTPSAAQDFVTARSPCGNSTASVPSTAVRLGIRTE